MSSNLPPDKGKKVNHKTSENTIAESSSGQQQDGGEYARQQRTPKGGSAVRTSGSIGKKGSSQHPFQLLRRTSMIVADTGERVKRPMFSPDM